MKSEPVTHGMQEDGTFVVDDRERMEWFMHHLEVRRRVEEQKPERPDDADAPEPAITNRT